MGFPCNEHIKRHARSKTIHAIESDSIDSMRIVFATGESLVLTATMEQGKPAILATPYRTNGEVRQTADIEKGI